MSLLENPLIVDENSLLIEKLSVQEDLPGSSDSSNYPKPVVITSLLSMENSNNAVDCVPLFRSTRYSDSVFKLPISELSFNGTLKHVQKLKPIVDPISALTSGCSDVVSNIDDPNSICEMNEFKEDNIEEPVCQDNHSHLKQSDLSNSTNTTDDFQKMIDKGNESTGDSQYGEFSRKNIHFYQEVEETSKGSKWSLEQNFSSFETSFDSGVRSPDIFSDHEDEHESIPDDNFWDFIKERETFDKNRLTNLEERLQGVLPPPSVTMINDDVTEMLKKYYTSITAFNAQEKVNTFAENPTTPNKRISSVTVPLDSDPLESLRESIFCEGNSRNVQIKDGVLPSEAQENSVVSTEFLQNMKQKTQSICTEMQAKETEWPHVLKCKYYDVYYNLTPHSEKLELLALKYAERCVGAETSSTVTVFSGTQKTPSSATKRKELRMKMLQGKSPGRRLSHLARRRQTFSAAAVDKMSTTTSKMVLIDKNFFPHRKLKYTTERKSPYLKKKTPNKKTPAKKTPAKTPRTRSGGSSRKKAMRRLLMDPDASKLAQPMRETSKRALFVSPDKKSIPTPTPVASKPQIMKLKRALFESPNKERARSLDGMMSESLKRKRDDYDDACECNRSKIAKSFSFAGDIDNSSSSSSFQRRSSDMLTYRSAAELNEINRKKLVVAVNEALRGYGCRMGAPGFRERMSALWRLTRRLMALPAHAARLAAPGRSTSEIMLKLARLYAYAIIQGKTEEECYQEERFKLANEAATKVTGYISATAYQEMKAKLAASRVKENTCSDLNSKPDVSKSTSKNVLKDKLVNVDNSSNSGSNSTFIPNKVELLKTNSMPSFNEVAKMRARRQISFDNIDLPKSLMKKFHSIDPAAVQANFHHRFHRDDILNKFPVLRTNPFCDRLFRVFSSRGDGRLSFEDMLDLCSVMSDECPSEVKAVWAFRIFAGGPLNPWGPGLKPKKPYGRSGPGTSLLPGPVHICVARKVGPLGRGDAAAATITHMLSAARSRPWQ
ncbi:Calcium and integrin-binding family member 3 [Eumeta japonica]|uniref:Calcium and integrin-binding family member 3 n=1 Tax=Eumeta variegata TaxID=151549 RepID=A0A4C1U8K0_EUMVA|nr:Calcium and integrin-binding family member 3 [Eumeta japonica]